MEVMCGDMLLPCYLDRRELPVVMFPDIFFQKQLSLLFTGLILLLCGNAAAQIRNRYHVSLSDGLPSNNVYSAYRDHHGYLWLSTEGGLVRYNGYSFENYTTADGLPSSEVFEVLEDRWHRLWIGSITKSLGYIRNNRFHPAFARSRQVTGVQPVAYIAEGGSGIWRLLPCNSPDGALSLFYEINDTFRYAGISFLLAFLDRQQRVTALCNPQVFHSTTYTSVVKRYSYKGIENLGTIKLPFLWKCIYFTLGPYFIYYYINDNKPVLYYTRVDRLSEGWKQLAFRDETGPDTVFGSYRKQDNPNVQIICKRNVYEIDSLMRIRQRHAIADLVGHSGLPDNMVSCLKEDSIWGRCICTRNEGVYFDYGTEKAIRTIHSVDLSEYRIIGTNDSVSWWWRDAGSSLLSIDKKGRLVRSSKPEFNFIVQFLTLSDGRSLMLEKIWAVVQQGTSFQPVVIDFEGLVRQNRNPHALRKLYFRKAVEVQGQGLYIAGTGLCRARLLGDTLRVNIVEPEGRYYAMEYDSAHAGLLVYNNEQVLFYTPGQNRRFLFSDTLLRRYGVRNIEKLFPHAATGTIFFNDHSDLYAADLLKGSVRRLNTGYNLARAKLCVRGDRLFLAGGFGVLICRITGPGQISRPLLYRNVRNSAYRQVKDVVAWNDVLLLSTDKQACLVQLPTDSELVNLQPAGTPYRLIISYRDTLYGLPLDTPLNITADGGPLSLDLINPYGTGRPVYRYALDNGRWQTLAGNELNLPLLEAGRYYNLLLQVSDNTWKSGILSVRLYKVPLWWQRPGWKVAFWVAGIICAVLLLSGVAVLTRYFVIRVARKKAFVTSLELRTIYAQINPHFIFNTLNTALFFIKRRKNDEAFSHISKFSQLLRAYLSSSRKRYLSVEEEIINLRNYIELQQTRFRDVFSYEITVDNLDPALEYLPTMILQPFVENAINHGLVPKEKAGHLQLTFRKEAAGHLICTVDDNGIGREQSKALKERERPRESFGNQLIQELVAIFNKYDKTRIGIDYFDKVLPETGTRVTITVKHPPGEQST